MRVRVFDDGLGFRYEVPGQAGFEEVNIVDELTEFHLPQDSNAWWIPARIYVAVCFSKLKSHLIKAIIPFDHVCIPFLSKYR